jgi:hypothetical protein
MHKGPENLVKMLLSDSPMAAKKKPPNLALPPEEQSPLNGPFISEGDFGSRILRFIWPRAIKASRLPEHPVKKPLGW